MPHSSASASKGTSASGSMSGSGGARWSGLHGWGFLSPWGSAQKSSTSRRARWPRAGPSSVCSRSRPDPARGSCPPRSPTSGKSSSSTMPAMWMSSRQFSPRCADLSLPSLTSDSTSQTKTSTTEGSSSTKPWPAMQRDLMTPTRQSCSRRPRPLPDWRIPTRQANSRNGSSR